MPTDSSSLPPDEARAFLHGLFPGGLRDPELLAELCPEGWEKSPLFGAFHPPPETAYREYLDMCGNMRALELGVKRRTNPPGSMPEDVPEMSYGEFLREHGAEWAERPIEMDPVREPAELLGLCLWDVFSDNHDVLAADGREVDLGSFRGTAGEIAEFFAVDPQTAGEHADPVICNAWSGGADYLDFYMGSIWSAGRADLTPVYRLIVRRIAAAGGDWRYSFPRLRLFSPGEIAEHAELPYDPSAAVADEQAQAEREAETRRMQKKLDRATLAAQREARGKPPPETVQAYQEVFGKFPVGWPPDPYDVESQI